MRILVIKEKDQSDTSIIKASNHNRSSFSLCQMLIVLSITITILLTSPITVECFESNGMNYPEKNNKHRNQVKYLSNIPDGFVSKRIGSRSELGHEDIVSKSKQNQKKIQYIRSQKKRRNKSYLKCTEERLQADIDDDILFEEEDTDRRLTRRRQQKQQQQQEVNGDENDCEGKKVKIAKDKHHVDSSSLMSVTDTDVSESVHVHVITAGPPHQKDCGGCSTLWQLFYNIKNLGVSASNNYDDGYCGVKAMDAPIANNKTIVFIYPEVYNITCDGLGNRVHIRWILAPLGINVNVSIAESWGPDNLVFNYAASDETIPPTNVLQVLQSPEEGDETDLPLEVVSNQEGRDGLIWLLRKAEPWKDIMDFDIINNTDIITSHIEAPTITQLLEYEYLLAYDPYTFYSFSAAMVGTVSIIAPLPGIETREQWELTTFLGVYLRIFGGKIPGIAYGMEDSEIDYARRTMPQVREFLFKVKAWGVSTISLVLRDALRFGRGERSNFEGAMLVKNVYSKDGLVSDRFFTTWSETHKHKGFGKDGHEDNGSGNDSGLKRHLNYFPKFSQY